MATKSKMFNGGAAAQAAVLKLVEASQWFQFEPLPCDLYEITVKNEAYHLLDGIGDKSKPKKRESIRN